MRSVCLLLALAACLPCANVVACELETRSYRVVLTERCAEGESPCRNVAYLGTNKANGQSIRLTGQAVVLMCADGVTPCRHLGYRFEHGPYVYFVGDEGSLMVTRHGKQILGQLGRWTHRGCRTPDQGEHPHA